MGKAKRTTNRTHRQPPKAPPPPQSQDAQKFAKLVKLLKDHPGQTAIELQHLGYRPETHGELKEAEQAGRIVWVRQKWFAV